LEEVKVTTEEKRRDNAEFAEDAEIAEKKR